MNKGYKKIPSYWWDFGTNDEIIVESDHPKFPVVGRFKFKDTGENGCAIGAINQAIKLIKDLQAGRVTPKNA